MSLKVILHSSVFCIFEKIASDMVTIIKQGADKKKIRSVLQELNKPKKSKGINAYKYCGLISLSQDPLEFQKKIRDEWK